MPGHRTLLNRRTVRYVASRALVALLAMTAAGPVLGLDGGGGAVISPQQRRRVIDPETGKLVRLDDARGHHFAGKAELSASQDLPMAFGSLCKKSGSVVLGTDDLIIEDLDHLVFGGVTSSAVIRLQGDPWVAVTIEITAPPDPGFTIHDFDTDLGPPPLFGQSLDGSGNLIFQLGARLTLDEDNIAVGTGQQISYTVTAFYE
jgi:hypothetical protein